MRWFGILALMAGACKSDQKFADIKVDQIAVTTGDFDRVEEALIRGDVSHTLFEGYISIPVYDPDADPSLMSPKVENLFQGTNEDGYPQIVDYDAVFVNSGTRGFGAYVYNGLETDDELILDARTLDALDAFFEEPRTLLVSDWAFDLVEAAFPDKIHFLHEEDGLDAAQLGTSDTVLADVTQAALEENLQSDTLQLTFDFDHWAVMDSVDTGVQVYLKGDVEYYAPGGEGSQVLEDVPLLVGFEHGYGRVIFSSFSWRAQRPAVQDLLLLTLIEGLELNATGDTPEDILGSERRADGGAL